jgi:hypothetical protein
MTVTLLERQYTFLIIYRSVLRMREMFQTKVVEKIKTHILCSITFFSFSENRAVYEIVWGKKCRVGQATDDSVTRRMRVACWISKATNTHSEYVILTAFLLQQWLNERASILRCTYMACLGY